MVPPPRAWTHALQSQGPNPKPSSHIYVRVAAWAHGTSTDTHAHPKTTAPKIVAGGQQPRTGQRADARRPRTDAGRNTLTRDSQLSREQATGYWHLSKSSYLRHKTIQEASTLWSAVALGSGRNHAHCPTSRRENTATLTQKCSHPNKQMPEHMTMRKRGARGTNPNCSSRNSLSSVVAVTASIALSTGLPAWEFEDQGSVGGVKASGRGSRQKRVDECLIGSGTYPPSAGPVMGLASVPFGPPPTRFHAAG